MSAASGFKLSVVSIEYNHKGSPSGLEQYPAIITFDLPLGQIPGIPIGMGNRYVGTHIATWRKLALKGISLLRRKLCCNDQ